MIGNFAPEEMQKWQLSFSNVPGLQDIELPVTLKNQARPTENTLTMTCTETENQMQPVLPYLRHWMELAQAPVEESHTIYATKRGAVVQYNWPNIAINFRSLRLARVFTKKFKITWTVGDTPQ